MDDLTLSYDDNVAYYSGAWLRLPWVGYPQCPCGRQECQGQKLARKTGHTTTCDCASCRGRQANKSGHKKQDRVLKDAARAEGTLMTRAPTHEEAARLLVHYESKSGVSIPEGIRGETMRKWEDQAEHFAHRQTPRRKWALVFTMPSGVRRIWMDFEEFLALVSEIQELP